MPWIRDGRSNGGLRLLGVNGPRTQAGEATGRRDMGQAEARGSPQGLRRLSPRRARPPNNQGVRRGNRPDGIAAPRLAESTTLIHQLAGARYRSLHTGKIWDGRMAGMADDPPDGSV